MNKLYRGLFCGLLAFTGIPILGIFGFTSQRADAVQSAQVPLVIMYHDIVDSSEKALDRSDLSISALKAHLDYLKSEGYSSISTRELSAHLEDPAGLPLPKKSFVLTFDDGYIGNLVFAIPALMEREIKADFFVHTNYVGVRTDKDHLSWENLAVTDEHPLFEVFSHTLSHARLTNLTQEALTKELSESRAILEEKLGMTREFFAYPYGALSKKVALETGKYYKLAYAIGPLERGQRRTIPLELAYPRIPITQKDESLDHFKFQIKKYIAENTRK